MLEELNLNDELKSLKISNSNSFLPPTSHSNTKNTSDNITTDNTNNTNGTPDYMNTDIKIDDINALGGDVDDDVLLTGYNIFVKLEKPSPDTVSYTDLTNATDPANTHNTVSMENTFEGDETFNVVEEDNTVENKDEKKSGWLMSSAKTTPKAHYVKNLKDLKRGKKNEIQLFRPKIPDLSSQSSTISAHTNNTRFSNNSHKFHKLSCQNCNKNNPYNFRLDNYNSINPYVSKYLRCNPVLSDGYTNDFVWDNNERTKKSKFITESINSWLKTILNIIVTFILIYILIVIFIILRKDIINHINNNKAVVHNKSQVLLSLHYLH